MEDLHGNPKLQEEYENTFDSEEKVSHALKLGKDNFTISMGVVDFEDLVIPDPIKSGRKETYLGLATTVGEMGILTPIHVMITEGYSEWVKEHPDEEYAGFKYAVIDGFRRIWAGYKNGLTRCHAMIWDFKDKDKGSEISTFLSLVLNKDQKRSWGEIWYLYQILEIQASLTPGTLEYLLQLESGDSMKLKDIMTCDYQEVRDDLLSNKKTISQAYNMLQKLRKEEDMLLKEDNTGIAEIDQAEGIIEIPQDVRLSDEDVKDILEMDDSGLELKEDDFDEMLKGAEAEVQKVGERHPLDPALKAESLLHDNYECVCCEMGKYLPMRYKLSVLQSHHKIAVAHGGPDSVENLATLCVSCHTLVHCLIYSNLKFGMSKDEFDELPTEEQEKLKKIMAIAKKDYEAAKRMGKDVTKEGRMPSTFKMPGTDLRENAKAIKEYASSHEVE